MACMVIAAALAVAATVVVVAHYRHRRRSRRMCVRACVRARTRESIRGRAHAASVDVVLSRVSLGREQWCGRQGVAVGAVGRE